jgi:DNA polymerase-3 subunit gamma/tau
MTQALARKWRPKSFDELVGQEHVVRALANALDAKRLHHAYLFTGTRGVGKTTLARIIAKAFNCERGVSPSPCGKCSACTGIDAGRFVDLLEVDAASNTQVDKMRDLLENALYAPSEGRYKVYVIDEVHQLSGHSFNAMLKTLEEPPEHVKFVLATTDPQKVPVTVLSRCLQFNLRQIPAQQIRARLETILTHEQIAFEAGGLIAVARAARGSLRDALSLLDQAIAHGGGKVTEQSVTAMLGLVGHDHLHELLDALAAGDATRMIDQADRMAANGLSFELALQELATIWHRIAVAQLVPAAVTDSDTDAAAIASLATKFDPETVQLNYQITNQGRADMALAPDEYAGFTMTLLRMLAFAPEFVSAVPQPVIAKAPPKPARAPVPPRADETSAVPKNVAAADVASRPVAPDVSTPSPRRALGAWADLVESIKVSGMAKQLAQHCELIGEADGVIELRLAESQKHLLEKGPQERLRASLEEGLGRSIRLRITMGTPQGQTPAAIDEARQRSRLADATEALNTDPFVRELVNDFGAEVVPGSIRPQR